ncbi:MAG TPA: ATP-grasp domain-containing protein [Acidimicrobiales bacterium]|jgi:biotin carboxylase|nr:ATP-grasp domain-containing protein [Acidimicrobiales bacterium]
MGRVLLLLPTATYRAPDFLAAASHLGVEVVVGSERRQAMARSMGDRAVVVPLAAPEAAVEAVVQLHRRSPLDAVLAVDDQGILVAAQAAERLGLRHNPPDAVAATRDKVMMRRKLEAACIPQPAFREVPPGGDVAAAGADLGYPCVIKPTSRSASLGVIRVDDEFQAGLAAGRIQAILGDCPEPLLVERFVPGAEVAVEGLLVDGELSVLAVFDKPDPLDGPYFEETIYVTPSRHSATTLAEVAALTARAAEALGLREGPVHAEMRIGAAGPVTLLELAARSIGGLCSRSLRFGVGVSLEEIIIRHALGLGLDGLTRETQASGVMMLPIRTAGVLEGVTGQEKARAVDGVVGLEISIPMGREVVPLPEGDRYLGFLFARGETADEVEDALRQAESLLDVQLAPVPVGGSVPPQ